MGSLEKKSYPWMILNILSAISHISKSSCSIYFEKSGDNITCPGTNLNVLNITFCITNRLRKIDLATNYVFINLDRILANEWHLTN